MCFVEVDPPTVDTGQRTEGALHRDGGSPPTFHGGAHSSGDFRRPVGDVRLQVVVVCLAAGAEHQTIGDALPRAVVPCLAAGNALPRAVVPCHAAGAEHQTIGDALPRAAVPCLAAGDALPRAAVPCLAAGAEHQTIGDALPRAAVPYLAAGAERRLRLERSADIADTSKHTFDGKEKDKIYPPFSMECRLKVVES